MPEGIHPSLLLSSSSSQKVRYSATQTRYVAWVLRAWLRFDPRLAVNPELEGPGVLPLRCARVLAWWSSEEEG